MREIELNLSLNRAKSFKLIPEDFNNDNGQIIIKLKSIEEKNNLISVSADVTSDKQENKTFEFDKDELTAPEATFIGWVYCELDNYYNEYKKKGKEYLEQAIKDEEDFFSAKSKISCLPYYLLAKNNLWDKHKIRLQLYDAISCDDTFPDYYWVMHRYEDDAIKKLGVIKKGLEKFPNEERLNDKVAEHLFTDEEYEDCKNFLLSVKQNLTEEEWLGCDYLRFRLFKTYLALQDYKKAEELLINIYNESTTTFLKGVLAYSKRNYKLAIKHFIQSIEHDIHNSGVTYGSMYYLLSCYARTRNHKKIIDIVKNFKLSNDDFQITGLDFNYKAFATKVLTSILKLNLDDLTKAKLKGLLAYTLYYELPRPDTDEDKRNLTTDETKIANKGLTLISGALKYYHHSKYFYALQSNFHFCLQQFDEAMVGHLKSLGESMVDDKISTHVSIEYCTDEFTTEYIRHLKEALENSSASINAYNEHELERDVNFFYKKKQYWRIADLYSFVKDDLDYKKISEWSFLGDGGLFKIAYSLKEKGDSKEAKSVYEKYNEVLGENSATLNNLCLIYEDEGNLDKAKELIQKAKKLSDGTDEYIDYNYNRLVGKLEPKDDTKGATPKENKIAKKPTLNFDLSSGDLILGKKRVHIADIGNYQYHICQELLTKDLPIGEWVEEQKLEDSFTHGEFKSLRWVKDAVYNINGKAKDAFKIKRLMDYKGARVRIIKEVFA